MKFKTDIILSAHGLSKSYGKYKALADLSFEVGTGEIVGLLGPNGAGKTTAIRILSTILPANRGQFMVMGIPDSRPEKIRARIGVVPESNGFPNYMTGEEFLSYMGRLYGVCCWHWQAVFWGKTGPWSANGLVSTSTLS